MKKRLIYFLTLILISNSLFGQKLYANKLKEEVNSLLKHPADFLALKFFYKKINKEDVNYFRAFLLPKIIQGLAEKTAISKNNIKISLIVLDKMIYDKNMELFLQKQRRSKIDIVLDNLSFYLNGTKGYLESLINFRSSHDKSENDVYAKFVKLLNDIGSLIEKENHYTIQKYEELENFINIKFGNDHHSDLGSNPFNDLDSDIKKSHFSNNRRSQENLKNHHNVEEDNFRKTESIYYNPAREATVRNRQSIYNNKYDNNTELNNNYSNYENRSRSGFYREEDSLNDHRTQNFTKSDRRIVRDLTGDY